MNPRNDAALARLNAAKLRQTPVRVGVLEQLGQTTQPLDVQQIINRLPADTDSVTVYRTLNTFVKKNIVHRVRGADRSWKYALELPRAAQGQAHSEGHGHPHFVCDACGQVECLSLLKIPGTLSKSIKLDRTYAVAYTEVMVHGVCPRCR